MFKVNKHFSDFSQVVKTSSRFHLKFISFHLKFISFHLKSLRSSFNKLIRLNSTRCLLLISTVRTICFWYFPQSITSRLVHDNWSLMVCSKFRHFQELLWQITFVGSPFWYLKLFPQHMSVCGERIFRRRATPSAPKDRHRTILEFLILCSLFVTFFISFQFHANYISRAF